MTSEPAPPAAESHDHRAAAEALISQASAEVFERRHRLAELESERALAKPPRQTVSLAALVVAVPVLIGLLLFTFTDFSLAALFEPRPPEPVARERAQKALDDLVVQIEAFRGDYDELPEGLFEIGVPERGEWSYTALGSDRYTVEGNLHGQRVTFDSANAPARETKSSQ